MTENIGMKVSAGIGYVVLLSIFVFLIITRDWSWWIIFWVGIIPIVLWAGAGLIMKFRKKDKKKEEKEPENIDLVEVAKYAQQWLLNNDDVGDIPRGEIQIEPYTPKQEGSNKLTVNKIRMSRYWNNDLIYLAMDRIKPKILMYHLYADEKDAEKDFDSRIDNIVLNPIQTAESEMVVEDDMGRTRTIKKRFPISYIKQEEEKKKAKKEEAEEGVEGEEEKR